MSTQKKKSEKNKPSLKGKLDKQKKAIKELSDINKKQIGEILDSTKKIVASIKEKLDQQEIEETFIDALEISLDASAELAEETVDAVVNSPGKQVKMNRYYNMELTEAVEETNNLYPQNMLGLMQKNIEKSQQFTIKNTNELFDSYIKNINLALSINQKVIKSMNAQLNAFVGVLTNKNS